MESSTRTASRLSTDQLDALISTRDRTLALIAGLEESQLSAVIDPLLSPLLWDLGHIGNFEQRWLLGSEDTGLDDIYNPFEHPRADRGELSVLDSASCLTYMGAVRERVLSRFDALNAELVELVIQHEQQHNETMLQLLRQLPGYSPPAVLTRDFTPPPASAQHIRLREAASRAYRPASRVGDWIDFPGGEYEIGSAPSDKTLIYDNERALHRRHVAAFSIAARPVTSGEFAEWIESGSYRDPAVWSTEGWQWLQEQGPAFTGAPAGWWLEGRQWLHDGFGQAREVDLSAPVCHVNWFEADAFARAHESRLPTEFEWEVAASIDPRAGDRATRRRYSWGDKAWTPGAANLDQLAFGTLPVGSADHGYGPIDMNGQVWEWTATEFSDYPGFSPMAYAEYSQPFFDRGYRVLRGGSWATRARSVDNRFRNWDLPQRRQIFAGLRLARDVQSEEENV